jgi:hypothetical protein
VNECRIAVGSVVLGLECATAEYAASLREYFVTGATDDAPDIRLKLEVVGDDEPVAVPDSLIATKRLAGDEFTAAGGLVTGRYDPRTRRGELRVHWVLTKAQMTRVFEQLLYQAFYSARLLRGYDAVLMHASGAVRSGDGFLFVGASGAGKSTVADLSQDRTVINDEVCLVEFGAGGAMLCSTPFNGLYRRKHAARAPLRAVVLLAHGSAHRLEPVGAADAVAALTGQVVAPLGLEDALSPRVSVRMLDMAGRLAAAAPVLRLVFTPDPGFWRVIDDEFPVSGGQP